MDPVTDAETVAHLVSDVVGAGSALTQLAEKVPAGLKPTGANPDLRREAYLGFQAAAWRAFTHANLFLELARITGQSLVKPGWPPVFQGRPRDPIGRVLTSLEASHETLSGLLTALCRVRMVGNPEPRAASERAVMMLGRLYDNLGLVGTDAEKARERDVYAAWQRRFGQAQKEYTEICRRDLALSLERRHWWQLRAPKGLEPWPGGWPAELEDLDAGGDSAVRPARG